MISNSSLQMHLQVVFGCAPSGKVGLTRSAPVSGHFHTSFCYLLALLFELPTLDQLFVSLVPVSQRLSDEYTVTIAR